MKNSSKKALVIVLCSAFIAVLGLLFYANRIKDSSSNNTVRIGAIVFLTGPQAASGNDVLNGLLLAKDSINAKGGILDKKLELLIEDSKDNPKDAITAFHKLVGEGVSALIVSGDVISYTLAPFAEKAKIPMISVIAGGADIPSLSEWVFRAWISEDDMAKAIATYARKNLGLKKVSVFAINNEFGLSSERNFKKYFNTNDCVVPQTSFFGLMDRDIRSNIAKLMKVNTDGVYVTGFGDGFSSAINQLKEANYNGCIVSDITLAIDYYQKQTQKGNENVYFVGSKIGVDAQEEETIKFCALFEDKFRKAPSFTSAFSYESLRFLQKAITQSGQTKDDIRRGLLMIKDENTSLGRVSYNENGELEVPVVIRKMHNGVSVLAD